MFTSAHILMGNSNRGEEEGCWTKGALPWRARLLRCAYRRLFGLGYIFYLPKYVLRLRRRGPWRDGFIHRLGWVPRSAGERRTEGGRLIWIHAVSVGEAAAATALIARWAERHPDRQFLLSTTTNTGRKVALERLDEAVPVVYFPADAPSFVRRALSRIQPDMLCLFESELWPTWIEECHLRGIPVCTVNGRMSPSAWKGYWKNRDFFSWNLNMLTLVIGQGEDYGARMMQLGVAAEKVRLAGSMKFDSAVVPDRADMAFAKACYRAAGFRDATIVLAASTHEGEELMLVQLVRRLQRDFPELRLVLVPRHIERVPQLLDQLLDEKQSWLLRSGLKLQREQEGPEAAAASTSSSERSSDRARKGRASIPVLIVDTTGELGRLSSVVDIVVVGKSFLAHGGQNPLEGAAAGRPVVVGPHMENFTDIVEFLLQRKAIVQVSGGQELEKTIRGLLDNPRMRQLLGQRARDAVKAGCGAMERTIDWLEEVLSAPVGR
ncbi:MAG: glycosyltransferase N-terminal domain-containing protein [Verrucomicrobiota bacterium]|nr:glycosyltransferase N-terminal domain-containing protein [Verrucomicrobiota bacterium]